MDWRIWVLILTQAAFGLLIVACVLQIAALTERIDRLENPWRKWIDNNDEEEKRR